MSVKILPLFEPVQLTGSAAIYFTAQVPTRIDKLTLANPSSTTAYTATLYLVPSGGSPSAANAIVTARPVQPLETWDVWSAIGQVLATGDTLQALASTAAALNMFAAGTSVSQ